MCCVATSMRRAIDRLMPCIAPLPDRNATPCPQIKSAAAPIKSEAARLPKVQSSMLYSFSTRVGCTADVYGHSISHNHHCLGVPEVLLKHSAPSGDCWPRSRQRPLRTIHVRRINSAGSVRTRPALAGRMPHRLVHRDIPKPPHRPSHLNHEIQKPHASWRVQP